MRLAPIAALATALTACATPAPARPLWRINAAACPDLREDRLDRREDRYDRRESRVDRSYDRGPLDVAEDRRDDRESRRDRRENRRDESYVYCPAAAWTYVGPREASAAAPSRVIITSDGQYYVDGRDGRRSLIVVVR